MVGDDLIHYYDELTESNHELYNSQERYIYIYIYENVQIMVNDHIIELSL